MQIAFQKAWKWGWVERGHCVLEHTSDGKWAADEFLWGLWDELWTHLLQGTLNLRSSRIAKACWPQSLLFWAPQRSFRLTTRRRASRGSPQAGPEPDWSQALGRRWAARGSSRGSTWWDTSASVRGLLKSILASPRTNPSSFCSILWPQSQVWKKWPFHSWGSGREKKKKMCPSHWKQTCLVIMFCFFMDNVEPGGLGFELWLSLSGQSFLDSSLFVCLFVCFPTKRKWTIPAWWGCPSTKC